MTYLEIGLVAICVYLVLAPPRYDLAIRLREWLGRPVKIDVNPDIDRTCAKCGGEMEPSHALEQTFTPGSPDFPGSDIVTMSAGGPGRMIPCRKCKACGWSVTV